jgi:hypothetical protein
VDKDVNRPSLVSHCVLQVSWPVQDPLHGMAPTGRSGRGPVHPLGCWPAEAISVVCSK